MAESFDTVDPFTQVYQAVIAALTASPLGDLVEVTVDFTQATEIPPNPQCETLPELIVAQSGWSTSPGSSKARTVTQAYPFTIATGSRKVEQVNQAKWALLQTLESLNRLELPFVRDVRVQQADDNYFRKSEARGDERWFTSGIIVVEMVIPKSALFAGS